MVKSPFFIQPNFRNDKSIKNTKPAGAIIIKIITPSQAINGLSPISRTVDKGPIKAHVPMPAAADVVLNIKMVVAKGPRIAETIIVGSQIRGLRKIFLNWSIDVPIPTEITFPALLSRIDIIMKPIICVQQPTAAAPPAIPPRLIATATATDEIGAVNIMPMTEEITTPINSG